MSGGKRLPIGIQTFRQMREEGYYYAPESVFIYHRSNATY